VEVLFLTFGLISGFGLALCYVAAIVVVAYYFEKRRSLATGLAVCGSGIGTFIFAPMTQYLIAEYGYEFIATICHYKNVYVLKLWPSILIINKHFL